MDAAQIADLLTQGIRGPAGPEDVGFHTGTVLSWDEISQVNSVWVNNTTLTNLRTVQSGIGVQYQAGDTVMIVRKQTQYFILGKITTIGSGNANQIKYAEVSATEATGSTTYTDLATFGPQLSINIGASRRFLLIVNCHMFVSGTVPANTLVGGLMTVNISGASTVNVVGTVGASWVGNGIANGTGGGGQFVRTYVMTAANGINPGLNTFTAKYQSRVASPTVSFNDRAITVIPF